VFVVTGFAFYYYILDAKSYWITHQKQSLLYAGLAAILIAGTLVVSLAHIETPSSVREMKTDQQMVGDLQDMQWRIEDFARSTEKLPETIQQMYGTFASPTPPEGEEPYVYEVTGENTYKLCATFNQTVAGQTVDMNTKPQTADRIMMSPTAMNNYNWDYQAGYWCFDRTIEEASTQ
jgi:hypothetical protein